MEQAMIKFISVWDNLLVGIIPVRIKFKGQLKFIIKKEPYEKINITQLQKACLIKLV